ncbi:unnamed protein product [Urochloa humidicola]
MESALLSKLSAVLADEYQILANIKPGIRFLKDELSSMYAVLQKLAEKEDDQIDPLAKEWRNKVRELSHSIEDCIDRFVLNHGNGGSKANIVRKVVKKVKMLPQDQAVEINELKSLVSELSERAIRYGMHNFLAASPQPVAFDARAPALLAEVRDLVRIDGPRDEIIELLETDQERRRNVMGMGTLMPKLTTMLSTNYQLLGGVKHGIRFLKDELSSMEAVLQKLADKDDVQMDPQAKEWRNKVHEISYDIEDCLHRPRHRRLLIAAARIRRLRRPRRRQLHVAAAKIRHLRRSRHRRLLVDPPPPTPARLSPPPRRSAASDPARLLPPPRRGPARPPARRRLLCDSYLVGHCRLARVLPPTHSARPCASPSHLTGSSWHLNRRQVSNPSIWICCRKPNVYKKFLQLSN